MLWRTSRRAQERPRAYGKQLADDWRPESEKNFRPAAICQPYPSGWRRGHVFRQSGKQIYPRLPFSNDKMVDTRWLERKVGVERPSQLAVRYARLKPRVLMQIRRPGVQSEVRCLLQRAERIGNFSAAAAAVDGASSGPWINREADRA